MKNKNDVVLHGECMIFSSDIPKGAKKKIVKNYLIIGNSETTGNHHVVDAVEGVDFYESDGKLYMNSKAATQVRCLHADRHDTKTLAPGSYEFGTQQEYDPFAARMQNVSD